MAFGMIRARMIMVIVILVMIRMRTRMAKDADLGYFGHFFWANL